MVQHHSGRNASLRSMRKFGPNLKDRCVKIKKTAVSQEVASKRNPTLRA
jgi:hypothetical protein